MADAVLVETYQGCDIYCAQDAPGEESMGGTDAAFTKAGIRFERVSSIIGVSGGQYRGEPFRTKALEEIRKSIQQFKSRFDKDKKAVDAFVAGGNVVDGGSVTIPPKVAVLNNYGWSVYGLLSESVTVPYQEIVAESRRQMADAEKVVVGFTYRGGFEPLQVHCTDGKWFFSGPASMGPEEVRHRGPAWRGEITEQFAKSLLRKLTASGVALEVDEVTPAPKSPGGG